MFTTIQDQNVAPAGERSNANPSFLFIGELARQTGLDPKTIRFYEKMELLAPPRHGRFRTFLSSDVIRLKNILALRRMGVSIATIRQILSNRPSGDQLVCDEGLRSILVDHLHSLRQRQEEIGNQLASTLAFLEN